jgi:hypothetical protein
VAQEGRVADPVEAAALQAAAASKALIVDEGESPGTLPGLFRSIHHLEEKEWCRWRGSKTPLDKHILSETMT